MFMNLNDLPAGRSYFTVAVTNDPIDTPLGKVNFDEIDAIAPSRSSAKDVVDTVRAEIARDYEDVRVVGVINQSEGFVMYEDPAGDLLS